MSSNDRKEIILLEKITTGCIAIEIWTSSDRIMREVLRVFLISKIFQWIRPQQITHGTKCWGLLEAIKLKDTEIISYTTKTLFRIMRILYNRRSKWFWRLWCKNHLFYVFKRVYFWRKTSMYAKELLVHYGGQRQTVEGFHASIVNTLSVLNLA